MSKQKSNRNRRKSGREDKSRVNPSLIDKNKIYNDLSLKEKFSAKTLDSKIVPIKKRKIPKWLTLGLVVALLGLLFTFYTEFIKNDPQEVARLKAGYINNKQNLLAIEASFGPAFYKQHLNMISGTKREALFYKVDSISNLAINNYYVLQHDELFKIWAGLIQICYTSSHTETLPIQATGGSLSLKKPNIEDRILNDYINDSYYKRFIDYLVDSFYVNCSRYFTREPDYR